jgi:hypothetical protein
MNTRSREKHWNVLVLQIRDLVSRKTMPRYRRIGPKSPFPAFVGTRIKLIGVLDPGSKKSDLKPWRGLLITPEIAVSKSQILVLFFVGEDHRSVV